MPEPPPPDALEWHDVTPDSWPSVVRDPYVFGQALGWLCLMAPRGVRVAGGKVFATFDASDPDWAAENTKKLLALKVIDASDSADKLRLVVDLIGKLSLQLGRP